MEQRNLGHSGLKVSAVGLGCNHFGRSVDAAGARAIVATCLELAIGWLASQPIIGSVICGATRPGQVTANVKAGTSRLSGEAMRRVDGVLTDLGG